MLPESEWRGLFEHGLVASLLGVLGRLVSLAHSTRRPRGWALLWEVPVAVGMGLIGKSVAESFHLTDVVSYGIIIAISYLGPHAIDMAVEYYTQKQKKS